MTTAADDRASEDAFEALLAGRPAPEGAAGLAAFTGAVRGAAASPGRPSAALADLLSTGLLTDQSSPSSRTAPTAGTARSRGRTRRRFPVIVTALIAKFLSAGAVAQAAAGAGVVVVVVAGAGTAGVLPGDAQTAFSDVTGISDVAEQPADEVPPPGEEVDGSLVPTDPTLVEDPGGVVVEEPVEDGAAELTREQWAEEGPADGQKFGEWVSYGASRGWNRDGIVAQWAHEKNAERKGRDGKERETEESTVETPEAETPEAETPEAPETTEDEADEQDTKAESDDDDRSKGKGKGKGEGRG